MFRTIINSVKNSTKTLARKVVKITMIAIAAAVLSAPVTVQAQQSPMVKFKENNKLEANGDGKFCYEIKLPAASYTQLKKNTPNTAVMLRKLGLNSHNMVIENVEGQWLDGASTLKIDFTVRGVARVAKDMSWEVPLFDGMETELVAVTEGTAVLTQASNIPGLGLATSTIRIALPPGATDVKALKNPARLSYKLPLTMSNSGEVKANFDLETRNQLMSSLAKVHGNKKFPALYAARSTFKNEGTQTLKDYRVRFRIAEYAPTWSQWTGTPVVVPGQTVIDTYHPIFDMGKIGAMTGSTQVAMEIQYQYKNADGKLVEDTETRELSLLSRNQVYYTTNKAEDVVDFQDNFNLSDYILGSFVTLEDPVMQQAAGRIANTIKGANAASNDEEAKKYMKAVYDFMSKNIAYQTPPSGGEEDHKINQHVKYGRDVLKNKAGTCIDLAILYGSLCEAVGLEPVLYMVPGHCFPAVRMPQSGIIIPIEATLIGKGTFLEANRHALDNQFKLMNNGQKPFILCDIAALHKKGVHCIELPNLADDVLNKWGIEWNFTEAPQVNGEHRQQDNRVTPTQPRPTPTPTPAPQADLVSKLHGTWGTSFRNQNGEQLTTMIAFDGKGGFGMATGMQNGNKMTFKGTVRANGDLLTFFVDSGESFTVKVAFQGDVDAQFTFENGNVVPYRKQN